MWHFNQHSVTNGCPPIHAVIRHYICQVLEANTNYLQLLCLRLITFCYSVQVRCAAVGVQIFPSPDQAINLHLCSCSLETSLFRTIFDHSNLSLQLCWKSAAIWHHVRERNVWRHLQYVSFCLCKQTYVWILKRWNICILCNIVYRLCISIFYMYVLCIYHIRMYHVYMYIFCRYYVHCTHITLHDCTYKEAFWTHELYSVFTVCTATFQIWLHKEDTYSMFLGQFQDCITGTLGNQGSKNTEIAEQWIRADELQ